MKFTNFLRTIFLKNICERLLLNIIYIETRTQMLSCEFCELFKNTYFLEDLQTACSQTPVRESFFNKVASLTSLKIVRKRLLHRYFSVNQESFFIEHLLTSTSHMIMFFSFFKISEVCILKSIHLVASILCGY